MWTVHKRGPYARRVTATPRTPSSASASSGPTGNADNLQRLRDGSGLLMSAALRRLDDEIPWYRELPAEDRSYVGLVAQSGITAFVTWYADPFAPPHGVSAVSYTHLTLPTNSRV